MGKRVSAKDMLTAGRARPPRDSPPEQPIIPAPPVLDLLVDESTSRLGDLSTDRLLDETTSSHVDGATSAPSDQASSELVSLETGSPGDELTSPPVDQVTSSPLVDVAEQNGAIVPAKPDAETSGLVAPSDTPTTRVDELVVEPGGDAERSAPGEPVDESTNQLGDQATNSPVDQWTSELVDARIDERVVDGPSSGKLVDQLTSSLVDESTGALVDSTTDRLIDRSPAELVPQLALAPVAADEPVKAELAATQPLVTNSPSRRVPKPPPAVERVSVAKAPVGEPTGTYQRLTVFLTPAQRSWLKNTGRQLPVEGLSVSDIVRLAVNRLSVDVSQGLHLVEELTALAHADAQTMAGRRNRGLPPI